ncbi:HAD-IA family hydrolase [Actinocatenispora rupis]|uniref:Phosphatase n=2 Tax=Actinocatenispora rupis TaxID=519421 RepID=A0A8J3NE79_9ACTN|nr:phosphatase [Actinocatenispora rupis]
MRGAPALSYARAMHLVWDWNGTLLDDFRLTAEATNAAFRTCSERVVDEEELRRRFRRPIAEYYAEVLGQPVDAAEFARLDKVFHDTYHGRLGEVGLAAGAAEALAAWPGTQSLLSMWFHDQLVPFVDGFGLTPHFARIDGLRDRVGGGSKTDHLVRHLAALGMSGGDCVLIGDTLDDAAAARAVGADCVLVTGGFTDEERLRGTGFPVAPSLPAAVARATRI